MMSKPSISIPFHAAFKALTGNDPFPWQTKLYEKFQSGEIPRSCNLPTGVGKTSVVPIWLIALANGSRAMPRRLVYVVNRRTVVDQTTDEVEKLRRNLELAGLVAPLRKLCAMKGGADEIPLAISTLRGQFADNREWSADPARPAVIIGTVDMIGSRLLFTGYGVGFKGKPLHAGFLGQDSLLVHDEAHLEPAFQALIEAIEQEQTNERRRAGELPWRGLRVMELTATRRVSSSNGEKADSQPTLFELTKEDKRDPEIKRRINARKTITLHPVDDEKKVSDRAAELALGYRDSGRAVIVYLRSVEDVEKVTAKLDKTKLNVKQLTGTLRGLERDWLATDDPIFARFLAPSSRPKDITPIEGTAYLVCTSAGEVGVNLSADHLVCDLSTFESMAQRFGRVNRFGEHKDSEIHVLHPTEFDEKKPLMEQRKATLTLLRELNGDASPEALGALDAGKRRDAFAPPPKIVPTSDILFDSWALTSIRAKLPGRPPVEPYLHGIRDWEPPETLVAWRTEVGIIADELRDLYKPEDLLEDYPLKPHELLRDRSDRVFKHLAAIAKRLADKLEWAWLVDQAGSVERASLQELADTNRKARIEYRTVLLSPNVGGLRGGFLDGESESADDVADKWYEEMRDQATGEVIARHRRRERMRSDDPRPNPPDGMRLIHTIDTQLDDDDSADATSDSESATGGRYWHWFERPRSADSDGSRTATHPVRLKDHTHDVKSRVERMVHDLELPDDLGKVLILAASWHDLGKNRQVWQLGIGNPNPQDPLAKAGRGMRPIELTTYRHEFGSLLDLLDPAKPYNAELRGVSEAMQDLVLHLIAVHHGRGRPHFTADEAFDPEPNGLDVEKVAAEVPRRFARLQRRYGRWGLAYLESLLRAADYAASAKPSQIHNEEQPSSTRDRCHDRNEQRRS